MNPELYQYIEIHPEFYVEPTKARTVWVLSTGRCGTLTMSALLNLSPNVVSFHEPYPRLNRHGDSAFWGEIPDELLKELVLSTRIDLVSTVNSNGMMYAECSYRYAVYCRQIKKAFHNAKFVWIVRDLDGFVRSAYNWGWYDPKDNRFGPGRITPRHPEESRERTLAWYYCGINQHYQRFLKELSSDDYRTLTFERLRSGDVDYLFDWLQVERPNQVKVQEVLSKKLHAGKGNAIDKTWGDFDSLALEVTRNGSK